MYGKSVNRRASVALVLLATLSGIVATVLPSETAHGGRGQEAAQQQPLPMLPEIVVTATRLAA